MAIYEMKCIAWLLISINVGKNVISRKRKKHQSVILLTCWFYAIKREKKCSQDILLYSTSIQIHFHNQYFPYVSSLFNKYLQYKQFLLNVYSAHHIWEFKFEIVFFSDARDAMAKALYGRLFGWIVNKANCLLVPDDMPLNSLLTEIGKSLLFFF